MLFFEWYTHDFSCLCNDHNKEADIFTTTQIDRKVEIIPKERDSSKRRLVTCVLCCICGSIMSSRFMTVHAIQFHQVITKIK